MSTKIAIVGMEAICGSDEGLDLFDRLVFDGIQQSSRPSPERQGKVRAGARSQCREEPSRLLAGLVEPSASVLARIVVEGALRDAVSRSPGRHPNDLAVMVVSDSELEDPRDDRLRLFREETVLQALERARALLIGGEFEGVVLAGIHRSGAGPKQSQGGPASLNTVPGNAVVAHGAGNGLPPGEGAGAVFMKRLDRAEKDRDRIYAVLDAIVTAPCCASAGTSLSARELAETCEKALRMAGIGPEAIGYIEVSGLGIPGTESNEIEGLALAYRAVENVPNAGGLTCALGNVKSNLGRNGTAAAIAGLIKTALCLYHRYIPATPAWTGPMDETAWTDSPFYVAPESRPWFLDPGRAGRHAAINHVDPGRIAHAILSEYPTHESRPNRYLALVSPYCFPIAGEDPADLLSQLEGLGNTIEAGCDLAPCARKNLEAFEGRSRDSRYALMVMGHTREEILREIRFMAKGIPEAFEKGRDLRTPKGSYFTPNPLGGAGRIAFVYPGVGSAYLGLGRGLFHLFPELYERFSRLLPDMAELLQERALYPRTRRPLTEKEIWRREVSLRKDIMTIGQCGMGFFLLYTMILRDFFKVRPDCALGYSLGEPGMLASLGVWSNLGALASKFRDSPTFTERLSGALAAVREFWNLDPGAEADEGDTWDSFTLQATPSRVREAIAGEDRVYLTIINAPDEVVIAGDPRCCKKVINKIGCKYYPLGLGLALHCEPARLEYDRILDLHTLAVNENPGIRFYSSSCYKPIPLRSKAIAHSIARAYSTPVDFPLLVRKAYEDGARLFIELGSRKFCSNLIDRILSDKEHLAMAINVKGTTDQASIVRLLAQLVSHRVPVDLSPLF